jgi:hypothetical protein
VILPDLTNTLENDAAVIALLGQRVFPFGEAPQDTPYPYATWQQIAGTPENYLAGRSNMDHLVVQFDVWAKTGSSAEACANAVRYALELLSYLVDFTTEPRDPDTGAYRFRLQFDFWKPRG